MTCIVIGLIPKPKTKQKKIGNNVDLQAIEASYNIKQLQITRAAALLRFSNRLCFVTESRKTAERC